MSLRLYYHPLASFCWKPLIALYENETPFTPHLVDLGNEDSRNAFLRVWPLGEFPVLHDEKRDQIIPQSGIIIEYLQSHYSGKVKLIPADPETALEARCWNSFYDGYVHEPMQKIVADSMRPESDKDRIGVAEARITLGTAYDVLEDQMKSIPWATGPLFTMADCSAAPALFYAKKVQSFEKTHPHLSSYLKRLMQRPSFARVLMEAEPYFHMFPYKAE